MVRSRVLALVAVPAAEAVAAGVALAGARSPAPSAQSHHLGRLAFWSVDRDQACGGSAGGGGVSGLPECSEISQSALDFTKIFTAYTG